MDKTKIIHADESVRMAELRAKHLSDLNSLMNGAEREGKDKVIIKILKNKPGFSAIDVAEMLEVDVESIKKIVEKQKSEWKR